MTTITFPSDTKDTIDAIRSAIGRDISAFVTTSVSGCALCSLDPINNTSTDSTCSGCNGYYWISSQTEVTITGHVRWYPFDEQNFTPGGIVYQGDCVVTVEYSLPILQTVQDADYFSVDSKRMVLDKYLLRGKPDVNRIRLLLKEEEK